MSKGYVKALAEQMSREGETPQNNGKTSGSVSPVGELDIKPSRVQNLVKAAEHKNEEIFGHLSLTKRPSLPNDLKVNGYNRKVSSPEKNWTLINQCRDNSPNRNNNSVLKKVCSLSPLNRRRSSSPGKTNILQNPKSPRKQSLNKPSIPVKPAFLSPKREAPLSPSIPTPKSSQSFSPNDSTTPIYAQVDKTGFKPSVNGNVTDTTSGQAHPSETMREKTESSEDASSDQVVLRHSGERVRRDSEQYRDSVFNTIYDNAPALTAAELFDSSWSDSDSYKDFSDEEDVVDGKIDVNAKNESSDLEEVKADGNYEDKRFKIASELLKTEQDYVAMLHLLHMVFFTRLEEENKQQPLFSSADVLKHIFSNTKSIYLFHNDFLLPQLEARMKDWDNDPRIGDLMKKNAPFLKLYSEYIRNFANAMKLLNNWLEKSTRLSSIIQEIQKQPVCGNLSLQHHMLGPIQRVPRYELLLKDYVKHLPADSPDMNDAKDALDLVTRAACHSNEAMVKIETFRKLLDIYQNLRGVAVDFISPTREFVMQGPITKISAKSGEKQPRYIFLFNDLVLICSHHLLGTYNVRCEMQVDGMEVKCGSNMNVSNTFMVHSIQKAVEFLEENNSPEPLDWEQKIRGVIETYKSKKRSIKQDTYDFNDTNMVPDSCLGQAAPVWIPDDAATMCMLCGTSFNMMRRRHHCRSCGKLVCKSCCSKAPLEYMQGKIERVCSHCYDVIVNKAYVSSPESSVTSITDSSPKKKGLVKAQVKASDPSLISSYVQCSEDRGKTWQRLWVMAHSDLVLYTFRAHEDVSAVSVIPLPGCTVATQSNTDARSSVFTLKHKRQKMLMYRVENEKKKTKWMAILEKLSKGELPDDSLRHSSESNSSFNSLSSDNTTALSTGDHNDMNDHLGSNEENDEKAEVRSQYDNVDP